MSSLISPSGQISARRLASMLGAWRSGSRQGAADLAAAIELQVLDGQLAVGTRLPAERQLAEELGTSRTLIGAAWDRLRESGMVESRRGAGSWVAARGRGGLEPSLPESADAIDFARASPSAAGGIIPALDTARVALADHLGEHGYSDRGLFVLRDRIARRYTERGLPTTPDQVMITNGAHHGFVLALRMLAGPGDRVLVENPSYPNALEAIRAAHAIPVPVALDAAGDQGWDIAGIEAAVRQSSPRLAYLVVDFQNPTGLRLDAEGRERLGAVLSRARTPFVVDETLVELDLDGDEAPPPLAASAPEFAITIGSSSKSHWGGLRIGWLRASVDVITRLVSARFMIDLGSPVFEQLVLAELLADPTPLLRRRREEFLTNRDALVGALRRYCPDWSFRVPGGGLSLWCRLSEPMSTRLAVAAGTHGVHLVPAARFGAYGGLERWVRLPYGLPPERLHEGVRRLSAAVRSIRAGAAGGVDLPVT
ncbi:MocR-like transcription factor YczR [Amycolatopsis sp. CA-230715]|uniref:MocR-like transcription factor YczR n=1 Tax=Amycolatopsis sp. CA-230715 TaxID=2745196 RepID=UPI001C036A2B|nr:PLP-dependent aminotransferase family protein [Amycolatopsis sp. CA-230715]QWF79954.1 Histidinol-phosphate aminotransferase [Amycolatopsis sp. CA-230715]